MFQQGLKAEGFDHGAILMPELAKIPGGGSARKSAAGPRLKAQGANAEC